jgi:hypothetical protein
VGQAPASLGCAWRCGHEGQGRHAAIAIAGRSNAFADAGAQRDRGAALVAHLQDGRHPCSRKNEPTVTISGKQWRARVPKSPIYERERWAWGRAKGDET